MLFQTGKVRWYLDVENKKVYHDLIKIITSENEVPDLPTEAASQLKQQEKLIDDDENGPTSSMNTVMEQTFRSQLFRKIVACEGVGILSTELCQYFGCRHKFMYRQLRYMAKYGITQEAERRGKQLTHRYFGPGLAPSKGRMKLEEQSNGIAQGEKRKADYVLLEKRVRWVKEIVTSAKAIQERDVLSILRGVSF
jgi:hypothetical protein